ncbi:MAG: carbohydrate binding family 9 domain-containing protein [Acidobacteria bacterium]|nr:carbohydrate binding family 9 domain-containing protein [Acidobacteriota bacterium]
MANARNGNAPVSLRQRAAPAPTAMRPYLPIFFAAFLGAAAGAEAQRQEPVSSPESKVMTAVRVENGRIRIDGELDEPEWNLAERISDFVQHEPKTGQPATERTEVRLLYDDHNLYVGVYCFDSMGSKGIVVNSLAKDFPPFDTDHFLTIVDTFDDNRNGFFFNTNPAGARKDEETSRDGADNNRDWDGIWYVKSKVTESGWQAEKAIPFKTLRFRNQEEQVWGINFQRNIRRKNEMVHWSLVPRPYRIARVSQAGTLRGISGVRPGLNLYLKPYVTAPVARRRGDDVDFTPDLGMDVKYALSSQLALDATANTDFSQVEADNQQINLTRFSLFFPEKREFFLENATIFTLGPFAAQGGSRDLIPFFTRRIGISGGQIVPILGGARLTGRVGDYRLGLLSIQVDDTQGSPSANFSTFRLRRNILRRSDMGVLLVNKHESGGRFNRTYGGDANFNFFNFLDITSFLLKTGTPELSGQDTAGHLGVGWADPRLTLKGSYLSIGKHFNPEVGFVPRTAIRKSTAEAAVRLRPEGRFASVRQLEPSGSIEYVTNPQNELETRIVESRLTTTFQNGGVIWLGFQSAFERLAEPFRIRPGHVLPPGDYGFDDYTLSLTSDRSRMLSGEFTMSRGEFYSGEKDSYRVGGRLQVGPRILADLTWSRDDVRLRSGDFQTRLLSSRLGYAFGPNMSLNALIQYNSDLREVSSNIRFNFTYKPLSDFYLVYNEKRDISGAVAERALIAKLTYIFAF